MTAEQVTFSETTVIKELEAPGMALDVPVLGTITDAQESERLAVEHMWPEVGHHVGQLHILCNASQSAYEADRVRKTLMCMQISSHLPRASEAEQNSFWSCVALLEVCIPR